MNNTLIREMDTTTIPTPLVESNDISTEAKHENGNESESAFPQAEPLVKMEEPPQKKLKTEEETPIEEDIPKFDGPPVHEMVGGSSVRKYLNQYVTPHLLEGLKYVAKDKPEDPLYELGQFLIKRSAELKQAK